MFRKLIYLFLFIGIVSFHNCSKNQEFTETFRVLSPPDTLIESSYRGRVLDENSQPIAGALVKAGQYETLSDDNGEFTFTDAEVKKRGSILKASRQGYFDGFGFDLSRAENSTYVDIFMSDKGESQNFTASVGGQINLDEGFIRFPANAIQDAFGNPYLSGVQVYARWIDPLGDQVVDLAPGAFLGRNLEGQTVALSSYGMIEFEITNSSGAELKIADDKLVELGFNIPAPLLADAPDQIPAWLFDEEFGWVEDGFCQFVDGALYTKSVAEPGVWNCDIPLKCYNVCGPVFLTDGSPIPFIIVEITDLNSQFAFKTCTDTSGIFQACVPENTDLNIRILDFCENELYAGEFLADMDSIKLDTIFIDSIPSSDIIELTGTIVQCNNAPITVGQLEYVGPFGGRSITSVEEDGSFTIQLPAVCSAVPSEVDILLYDIIGQTNSGWLNYTYNQSNDLGNLKTCNEYENYFEFESNGTTYKLAPTFYSKSADQLTINTVTVAGTLELMINNYQGLGTYTDIEFLLTNNPNSEPQLPNLAEKPESLSIQVTQDNITTGIRATINGTLVEQGSGLEISGQGSIRTRRIR